MSHKTPFANDRDFLRAVQGYGASRYPVTQLLHSAVNKGLKAGQLDTQVRNRFDAANATEVNRATGVWNLNPRDMHLMPLMYNPAHVVSYMKRVMGEMQETYHKPNLAPLVHTYTAIKATMEDPNNLVFDTEVKLRSTLVHSMSLAPTRAFFEQLQRNVVFQSKWNENNLYSQAHDWFSLTHSQIMVDEAFATPNGCAMGAFLSNEEIDSLQGKLSGSPYFKRVFFDACKIMQFIQKNVSYQYRGAVPDEAMERGEDPHTDIHDVDIREASVEDQWDWFKYKRNDIGVDSIKSNPSKVEMAHGTLYSHTTKIIVTIDTTTPVSIPEYDKACHGLKAVFEVVTETFHAHRLETSERIEGHFSDVFQRLRPDIPLSQHITIKLGYGQFAPPTKDDIAALPVCIKVATVNAGFMEVDYPSGTGPTGAAVHRDIMWPGGSINMDQTAGIAHVLGQGMPFTLAIGNKSFPATPMPDLFVHDIAFTQPTLNTHFFLLVHLMQCIREIRLRSGFTKSLMAPWAKLLSNNPARTPLTSKIQDSPEVLDDIAAGNPRGDEEDVDENTSRLEKQFQMDIGNEQIFAGKAQELWFVINHILRNSISPSFGHTLADMLSLHSHTNVDGGVVVLGDDSLCLETPDRASLAMVFVPVARDHTVGNLNPWVPEFDNTFVGGGNGMPGGGGGNMFGTQFLNASALPFNPWASMGRDTHLDARWSPTTELSGYADLDLNDIYGLASKSSVFDG